MPGDVQLTSLAIKAAPLDYVVPGSAVVRVKSVRGLFTDNSAGGDWLPAVELISDSGHIIATASDQGAKITAGGDAAGSFFPGAAKAAATSKTVGSWLRVVAGTSVPSGTIATQLGTDMPIADFDTNDHTRFVQTTATAWTMTNGVYTMDGELRTASGATVVVNGDFTVGVNSSSGFVAYAFAGNGSRTWVEAFTGLTIGNQGSVTPWHMVACGADTHAWVGQVNIVHVLGT